MYWQGKGYTERVMLIYDGLHYDALALAGTLALPLPIPLPSHNADLLLANGTASTSPQPNHMAKHAVNNNQSSGTTSLPNLHSTGLNITITTKEKSHEGGCYIGVQLRV